MNSPLWPRAPSNRLVGRERSRHWCRRATRHAAFAATALALALVTSAHAAPRFATDTLDRWIERLHAVHRFSGAVVIERNGSVVYARSVGVANPATRRRFTPDTPSDGASLAKPVTATMVLMLAETGSVDLDAPVRRYVAEYPDATTTVRDLLSHRAALPDYADFPALFSARQPVTTAAMLAAASASASAASPAPSVRFTYCNLCLDTAALLVERVTGQPFAQALERTLLDPLGIRRMFVRPARLADMPANAATGYRFRAGRQEPFGAQDLEGFHGGSNLYGSARDFARFASAFATGAAVPGGATIRRAVEPAQLGNAVPSGLTLGNWYCADNGERCYYTGAHRGFYNVMYWDGAQRLVVVFVSNSGIAPWLQPRIVRELLAAAEGREISSLREPALVTLTEQVLAEASGTYDVPAAGRVTLRAQGSTPSVRTASGVEYRLYPLSPTLLYAPGLDAYIGVSPDRRLAWTTGFADVLGMRVTTP